MRRVTLVVAAVLLVVGAGMLAAEGPTAQDLVAAAKKQITGISVAEAKAMLDKGGYLFIDVREPNETNMGIIPGAITIPRGLLEFQIASKVPDQGAKIVIYCKSGGRGALATQTLVHMGYANTVNMDGGWMAWEQAGYPVD